MTEHQESAANDPLATQPIPVRSTRWRPRDSFWALESIPFRVFVSINAAQQIAIWMLRVAIEWAAFVMTGSAQLVGLLLFAQMAPVILFGQLGAFVADRFPPRLLLLSLYVVKVLAAAGLAATFAPGFTSYWFLLAISLFLGLANVIEIPTRTKYFAEVVSHRHLQSAISLNGTVFWSGGVIGPLIAGLLIASFEIQWFLALLALTSLTFAIGLALLRGHQAATTALPPRRARYFLDGIQYARRKPDISITLVLLGIISILCLPFTVTLPVFARDLFRLGAEGFGVFVALFGVGAVVGTLTASLFREMSLKNVFWAAVAFALVVIIVSVAGVPWIFAILLFFGGIARLVYELTSNVLVQLSTNRIIRARVFSIYVTILVFGQAVGGLLIGLLTDLWGPTLALATAGLTALVATVVTIASTREGRQTLRRERPLSSSTET